jgi:hypothetical protein
VPRKGFPARHPADLADRLRAARQIVPAGADLRQTASGMGTHFADAAMRRLAWSLPSDELNRVGFLLYERFRRGAGARRGYSIAPGSRGGRLGWMYHASFECLLRGVNREPPEAHPALDG